LKFAAFFRNLNLGRPPAPARTPFEEAFAAAGAEEPRSFLTNGSLVFSAKNRPTASRVLSAARRNLASVCGLQEPAFLREVEYLAGLVALDPFAYIDRSIVYGCYVTFLPENFAAIGERPATNGRGDVAAVQYTGTELLSCALQLGKSPGSPNAFAEKAFQMPATTRAWNTIVRLVERHA